DRRGHRRHQPERGGRGDRALPGARAQAARRPGHPLGLRHAGGRRHRVHRRSDAGSLARRAARDVREDRTDPLLLPRIVVPPPGPRSRALSARRGELESPGVNTLFAGAPSLLWEEARGANVRDVDGNLYIDVTSGFGVAAVGHAHPEVVRAIREQAGVLLHGLGDVHAHPLRVELAERLVRLAPVDDPQVFFSISGAEAVEIALKTAVAA